MEESRKSVGENFEEKEMEFIGCWITKIVQEIETSYEIELSQDWSSTEEANTVDIEEVMRMQRIDKGYCK